MVLAAGLLLVAACGSPGATAEAGGWWSSGAETATAPAAVGEAGGADASGMAAPPAAAPASPPPAAPPPAGRDDEPAPPLAAPGSSPEEVWRRLTARHTWLYRHPDPGGLEQLYAPDCSCLAREREQLAALAAKGRFWSGERPRLTAVEVRDAAAPDLLALRATYTRAGDSRLVDAGGTVHETLPARESIVVDVVLVREGATAPWLVRALSEPFATPGVTP